MKKIVLALIAILLLAAPVLAETKIACIDLPRAMGLSKAGKIANDEISSLATKYKNELMSKEDELKALRAELEKQGMLLSDSAKAEKEREFQQGVKDLQRAQKDYNEELQQRRNEATQKLLEQMRPVIQKLGKDGGYQMIVEKNQGAVIYSDQAADLTEELVKAFDAVQ